jgi:hypothetical protein
MPIPAFFNPTPFVGPDLIRLVHSNSNPRPFVGFMKISSKVSFFGYLPRGSEGGYVVLSQANKNGHEPVPVVKLL